MNNNNTSNNKIKLVSKHNSECPEYIINTLDNKRNQIAENQNSQQKKINQFYDFICIGVGLYARWLFGALLLEANLL